MKDLKISILFVFLIVPFIHIIGQNPVFGENGSTWKFDVATLVGPVAYEINQTRNIIEQGKACIVYETTLHSFFWDNNLSISRYSSSSKLEEYIIHTSGDTVFFYHNGEFKILYNFAAKKGDSWDLGFDNNIYGGNCSKSIVNVAFAGDTMINGEKLRYLKTYMDTNSSFMLDGIIIEKIGRLTYTFPKVTDKCSNVHAELPKVWIKCFYSDSFPTFKTGANFGDLWMSDSCSLNFFLGEEKFTHSSYDIDVYPNPTSGAFYLNFGENIGDVKIDVFNPFGQLLSSQEYESAHNKVEVYLKGESGLYIIEISNKMSQKRIIKVFKQ